MERERRRPPIAASWTMSEPSIMAASTKTGLNMDAVNMVAKAVKETASLTTNGVGCCRLVVFANAPEDNPFMAGAFFGLGEGDSALNVGVSGPGVIRNVLDRNEGKSLNELAEEIKRAYASIIEETSNKPEREILVKRDNIYKPISQKLVCEIVTSKTKLICQSIKEITEKNVACSKINNFSVNSQIGF
jgi:NurA-like 5'-3' nuclease